MKKYLILILFAYLVPSYSFSQSYKYVPFPDSGAIWSEYYYDSYQRYFERFALSGEDTVINEFKYKKLYLFYDTVFNINNAVCIGGIREDSLKRIYFKGDTVLHYLKPVLNYKHDEIILYDFSVCIGDTLWKGNFPEGECLIVKDIDTILIGDTLRKRISFENFFWVQWIEGIGSTKGLLFASGDLPTGGNNGYLICFKQNDTILYFNDSFDDCMPVIQGVQTKKNTSAIRVYPNPSGHSVSLRFEKALSQPVDFVLYDVSGRKVKQIRITGRETEIGVADLGSGFYFYEVQGSDNSVRTTGKLIIK